MTQGHDLLRAAIREGGQSNVRLLKPELFTSDELPAFNFFNRYYLSHAGELPPLEAFLREGIALDEPIQIPGQETSFLYKYELVVRRQKSKLFERLL